MNTCQNLIVLLQELNKLAPDVCQLDNGVFSVANYHFWHSEYYGFCAGEKIKPYNHITGRPALAWLESALRQVIEARGWQWSLNFVTDHKSIAEVKGTDQYTRKSANTPTEALLAALLAALEER